MAGVFSDASDYTTQRTKRQAMLSCYQGTVQVRAHRPRARRSGNSPRGSGVGARLEQALGLETFAHRGSTKL
jgi:hypothetical protein